jgi:hypothetical protein
MIVGIVSNKADDAVTSGNTVPQFGAINYFSRPAMLTL